MSSYYSDFYKTNDDILPETKKSFKFCVKIGRFLYEVFHVSRRFTDFYLYKLSTDIIITYAKHVIFSVVEQELLYSSW